VATDPGIEVIPMKSFPCLAAITLGIFIAGAIPHPVRADDKDTGTRVKIDDLASITPASWKEEKPATKLRAKQFRVPRVGKDKEDAEVVIFFFGKGVGGSLDDNLGRWKSLFYPPKGKKIDDVTKIEKMKAGDVPFTVVEVHGTYKGSSFMKMDPKPNYRMLKVYFDSKNGPYFLSLTGPDKTVEASKKGFLEWVKGFK
jgi:hypothetical protein